MRALGWLPQVRFEEGLAETVAWYRDNAWWWEPIRSGDYREYYERQYGQRPELTHPSCEIFQAPSSFTSVTVVTLFLPA